MQIQGVSGIGGSAPIIPQGAKPKEPEKETTNETTMNTDKVDREIERLKQKKQQLEQQMQAAQDEQRKAALSIQIRQVEMELQEKDNDNYRRQNAVIS